MNSNVCNNCGNTLDDNNSLICPKCGYNNSNNNLLVDYEIDAIIDSIIDDEIDSDDSRIIYDIENQKSIIFDEDDSIIYRNNDKCINCGLCKKTCERDANISFDLNKCKKPICTSCGLCVKNCPSNALCVKEDYREVKRIINENEKLVVAIVTPEIKTVLSDLFEEEIDVESKFVEGLKKIGFDYIFNGDFGCELYSMELVGEIIERINNKGELPLISSSCPSWINYAEIYHHNILNNISTCKNPLVMQSAMVKNYFAKEKGFDSNKIVTVGLSTCTSKKMESNDIEKGLDYVLNEKEVLKLFEESEIVLQNLNSKEYDQLLLEGNSDMSLFSYSGGESYSIIKFLYKIIMKEDFDDKNIINEIKNIDGIKELIIKVGNSEVKVAVVNQFKNIDRLIESNEYRKYHYIEVMNCKDGCIGRINNKNVNEIKNNVFDNAIDNKNANKLNKELEDAYKALLIRSNSTKSWELLHIKYSDKSSYLNNK